MVGTDVENKDLIYYQCCHWVKVDWQQPEGIPRPTWITLNVLANNFTSMSLPLLHLPALCHVSLTLQHLGKSAVVCSVFHADFQKQTQMEHLEEVAQQVHSHVMLTECFLQLSKVEPLTQQTYCKYETPSSKPTFSASLQLFECPGAQIKHAAYAAGSRGRPDSTADL